MPEFLKKKLAEEYDSEDPSIKYKIMNKKGYMKGNKITSKGEKLQEKHDKDMKERKHRLNLA